MNREHMETMLNAAVELSKIKAENDRLRDENEFLRSLVRENKQSEHKEAKEKA